MEKTLRYCIGIDVDKKEFKANFRSLDSAATQNTVASRTFSNTKKGFGEFEVWIAKNRKDPDAWLTITMEATGVYHENLAWYFHGKGFNINIVLPLKAKRYLQSLGLRSKNDQIDAQGLATMGLQQQLDLWQPGSMDLLKLRSLTRQYEAIQTAKTTFGNQLEAVLRKLLCLIYTLWKTDQAYDPKKKDGHSKKEEPESPLSGKILTIESSAKTGKPTKNSSPEVHRATLDGLYGKLSPSSPLSGKTKILEKSYQ